MSNFRKRTKQQKKEIVVNIKDFDLIEKTQEKPEEKKQNHHHKYIQTDVDTDIIKTSNLKSLNTKLLLNCDKKDKNIRNLNNRLKNIDEEHFQRYRTIQKNLDTLTRLEYLVGQFIENVKNLNN